MTDPVAEVKAAAATEVVTLKAKVAAFVSAHAAKVVSAGVGFGVAKLNVISFIWKLI